MQIQEWLSGSFNIRDVYGCIGTDLLLQVKSRNTVSIRKVAKLLGCITASFAGGMYGPLYSKQLEVEKTHYLKLNHGNFDAKMTLSSAIVDRFLTKCLQCHLQTDTHKDPLYRF